MAKRELIGDYIHAHYQNYKKYGTEFKTEDKPDISKIIQDQHDAILNNYKTGTQNVSDQQLAEISNYYNFIFDYDTAKTMVYGLSKGDWTKIQTDFYNLLQKKLQEEIKNGEISIDESGGITGSKSSVKKQTMGSNWTSMNNLMKGLQQIILEAQDLIKIDPNVMSDIEKIKSILRDIANKEGQSEQELNQLIIDDNLFKIQEILTRNEMVKAKDVESKIIGKYTRVDDIGKNHLINLVSSVTKRVQINSIALAMGIVGEEWGPQTQQILKKLINKQMRTSIETIERVSKKNKNAKISISDRQLGGYYATKNSRYADKMVTTIGDDLIGKTELSINATEDKVDCEIAFSDGKNLAASIKNYSPHTIAEHGIGLLKGTDLIKYTQDYPEFINHYLNITVDHTSREDDERPTCSEIQSIHEAMKITMGAVALAGGTYHISNGSVKRERFSDLFIINRQGTRTGRGKYEVFSTLNLINKLAKNAELVKLYLSPDYPWDNKWQEPEERNYNSAYARCIKILQQIHKIKIRVSMDSALLN